MKKIVQLFSDAASAYGAVRGSRLAAALAFYAILSLSPLLIVAVGITQTVLGSSESVREQLTQSLERLLGGEGASMINPIIESASQQDTSAGLGLTIVGILIALFTASNVFAQLQDILNRIWRVQKPKRPFLAVIQERLVGVFMVLLAGVVLLLLFLLNSVLRAVITYFPDFWIFSGADWLTVAQILTTVVLLVAIFALMFRTLPASQIAWRDVWIGALFTAVVFALGLQLIGWYLTLSTAGSAYGPAASLLVTLLAFYYAAQIFLFGAQFTYVFSQSRYGVSHGGGTMSEESEEEQGQQAATASGD
jgi:membrane protein